MESSVETSQTAGPSNPKPVLAPKPRLTPKPFSLQKNTTIRSIHAPKTLPAKSKTNQTGNAAVTSVPKPTLPTSAQKPPQPTSTSHSKPCSVSVPTKNQPETTKESEAGLQQEGTPNSSAGKSDPASETAPPKEAPKSEPIQKDDVIQTNHKTDTEANSEQKDGKKKGDETQPSAIQKPAESGCKSPSTTAPAYRWGGSRKRLSMELTSKFESVGLPLSPQPAAATNSKEDSNNPVSSDSVQSQTKPEPSQKQSEEGGQKEDSSGGSIKRRISLLFDSPSRPEVMTKKEELEIINGTGGGVKERIKNWAAEASSEGPKTEKKLPQVAPRARSRSFEPTAAPAAEEIPQMPSVEHSVSETSSIQTEDPVLKVLPAEQTKEMPTETPTDVPAEDKTLESRSEAPEEQTKSAEYDVQPHHHSPSTTSTADDEGSLAVSESTCIEPEPALKRDSVKRRSVRFGIVERDDGGPPLILGSASESSTEEEEEVPDDEVEEEVSVPVYRRVGIIQRKDDEIQRQEEERLKHLEFEKRRREEENEEERLKLEEQQKRDEEEREKEKERLKEEETQRQQLNEKEMERQRKEELERERLEEEKRENERLREEEMERERQVELMWQRQREEERERAKQKEERLKEDQEERENERLKEEEAHEHEGHQLEENLREERIKEEKHTEEEWENESAKKTETLSGEGEEEREKELELMWQRQKEDDRERAKQAEERLRQEEQEEREKEQLREEAEERERRRRLEEEERMRERLRQVEEERKRRELERKMQQEKEEEMERMRQIEKQKEEQRREEERMRQIEEERAKELERKVEEELERKRADEKLRIEEEKERKVLESSVKEEEGVVDKSEQNLICFDTEDLAQKPESNRSSSPTAQVPTESLIDVVYDDFSVRKPLIEVDFDDFSVKPKRRGSKPRADTTPTVQTWGIDLIEKEEVKELVPLDVNPQEDTVPEQVDKPDSPVPTAVQENPEEEEVEKNITEEEELISFEVEIEEEEKMTEKEEEGVETKEEGEDEKGEDEEEEDEDQQEAQVNSYCTNKEDKDTEVLIDSEPDQQDGVCGQTYVSDSPKPVPDQVPEASSEDVDTTDLPELAPFPESTAPLLDTSAQRSKADLGKRRNRTRRSRSVHGGLVQTEKLDWRANDSTDGQDGCSKQESDSEEEQPKPKTVCSPPPSSQRVPMFPGMNPAALIAQLKKRTGGGGTGGADETEEDKEKEEKESPNEEVVLSPSHLSRSPRSAAQLAGAARVLPPLGGMDGGAVSSPAWLKELKSKKRLSQHEGDA